MKNLLFIVSLLFLISCGSEPSGDEIVGEDSTATQEQTLDDANAEFTAADTSSTGVYQEEVDENAGGSLQDALKSNTQPENTEEGGMSFCDCVKKQKQLEKTMLETEDDAEFDKAIEELNAMKTGECKILFEGDQSTIEAKQAHERRVKKCL